MIELLIQFLVKNDKTDEHSISHIPTCIQRTIDAVYVVVLHPKTNTSLKKRAPRIRKALQTLEEHNGLEKHAESIERLVETAEYSTILGPNRKAYYCQWCWVDVGRDVERDQVKNCARCKKAIYCSRECQRADWIQGGHMSDCKFSATALWAPVLVRSFGLTDKESKTVRKVEKNLSICADSLLVNEMSKIMVQASIRRYNIKDCVVLFHFQRSPPQMVTIRSSDFLSSETDHNECLERFRCIVEQNQNSGLLTVVCATNMIMPDGSHDIGNFVKTILPSAIPYQHDDGTPYSWNEVQRYMTKEFPLDEEKIQSLGEEEHRFVKILETSGSRAREEFQRFLLPVKPPSEGHA